MVKVVVDAGQKRMRKKDKARKGYIFTIFGVDAHRRNVIGRLARENVLTSGYHHS